MGLKGVPLALIEGEVMRIGEKFSTSVESFYDTDTLQRGWLEAVDRDGEAKNFPLMSVSAAIMELPVGLNRIYSPEEISRMMARMKKKSRNPKHRPRKSAHSPSSISMIKSPCTPQTPTIP